MAEFSSVSGEDIKAQLSEYHIVVADVIGGISADLLEIQKRVTVLERQNQKIMETLRELEAATRILVRNSLQKP